MALYFEFKIEYGDTVVPFTRESSNVTGLEQPIPSIAHTWVNVSLFSQFIIYSGNINFQIRMRVLEQLKSSLRSHDGHENNFLES